MESGWFAGLVSCSFFHLSVTAPRYALEGPNPTLTAQDLDTTSVATPGRKHRPTCGSSISNGAGLGLNPVESVGV